jgi:hypothetical protein
MVAEFTAGDEVVEAMMRALKLTRHRYTQSRSCSEPERTRLARQ